MNEIVNIFSSQDASGLLVTWAIVGVFAIGALDVFRSMLRLMGDRNEIQTARAKLSAVSGASDAAEVLSALHVDSVSLLGKRIGRVLQLRAAGLAYRDVPQKLSIDHVERYGATARFIGTILTMLGLVGTVVGMSFAMVRMSGAFNSVNDVQALNQLTQALSGTLQGMQTAFACTLAGLSSAVVLSLLTYWLRRMQSRVVRELEEFVVCEVLPILEKVDPEADQAAKAFAQVLTDVSGKLTSVCTTLVDVSTRYAEAGGEMTRTASTLGAAVAQLAAATSALDTRVETLEENARTSRAVQDSIVAYNDQFKALVERNNAEFKTFMERNTSQLENALKQLLHNVNEHYQDGVRKHVDSSQQRLAQLITDNTSRFTDVMSLHSTKLQSFSDMMLEIYVNGRKPSAKDGQA